MLKLKNISKYYHSGETVVLGLRKVNLELKLGEFVVVTGESGSGKSTLLNVISGLDTYEDGEFYINGEETSYFSKEDWEVYRRQYIGFIFQDYNIIDSYSVLENVMIALTIQGYDKATRKQRALELIDKVGLSSHAHHKAAKLSGGQKQRAVIARALAKDCPIIVADEPTGNLDSETGKQIMKLLKDLSKDKLVIVVTHNYEQVKDYATRKVRLFDGEVVEDKVIIEPKTEIEGITLAGYYMSFWNLISLSFKNLLRTPRRTIFTIFVAIFISMAFVLSFGSYMRSVNQPYYYGGGYFSNITEKRIIVSKFNGDSFTDEELSNIENINGVIGMLNHDVLLDKTVKSYTVDYGYMDYREYYINPVAMLLPSEIIKGRLPESEFEVVVEDNSNEFTLGDNLTLTISDSAYVYDISNLDNIDSVTVEVVGIVKKNNPNSWQGNMYFYDDFLTRDDVLMNAYLGSGWNNITRLSYFVIIDNVEIPIDFWGGIILDDTIPVGEIRLGNEILRQIADKAGVIYDDNPTFYNGSTLKVDATTNFYQKTITLNLTGEYNPTNDINNEAIYSMAANPESIKQLIPSEPYQITVFVRDSFDAKNVQPKLQDLGYNAIYPASVSNQFDEIARMFSTLGFTILMVFLMFIVFWVTFAVLRNVQTAKKKDYLIFRSIGASKKDLYKVTNLELMIAFLLSLLIVITIFIVNEIHQIWVIPQYLRYFNLASYLSLVLILTLLALLLGRKFNKKIFDKSVITSLRQE